MRAYIQRPLDGKFLDVCGGWHGKNEAYAFANAAAAIDYCMVQALRKVRIILELEGGREVAVLEFLASARVALSASMEENRKLSEEHRESRARLDAVRAEGKEKKRRFSFPRKKLAEGLPPDCERT